MGAGMTEGKRKGFFWGMLVSGVTLLVALLGFLSDAFSLWDRFFPPTEAAPTMRPVQLDDAVEVLNLRQGNWWSYSYGEMTGQSGGEQELGLTLGSVRETVVLDAALSESLRVIGIDLVGDQSAMRCPDRGVEGEADYWYLTDGQRVYLACDEGKVNELANLYFKGSPGADFAPMFVIPLAVGAAWPAFDGESLNEGGLYNWNVTAQEDVSVPAGDFKGCYQLVIPTGPDRLERWVCPGVGIAAENYIHAGDFQTFRLELVDWSGEE